MDSLVGKRVTVVGLGHFGGGIGAVRWLMKQGANVVLTDLKPAEQLADGLAAIQDLIDQPGPHGNRLQLALGGHQAVHFAEADLVVASPAVPPRSEWLSLARGAAVRVSTEIQLLIERLPPGICTIGVTGSNGKSTTTAMIHHLLEAGVGQPGFAFRHVWLGGNIGISLLDELPNMQPSDAVVLELSSFMLEAFAANGLVWSPQIAVVTNLTPNHLDRHGTMAEYAAAKQVVLRHQSASCTAIINADDDATRCWGKLTAGRVTYFSGWSAAGGSPPAAETVTRCRPGGLYLLSDAEQAALRLPGEHNRANAAAACAAHAAAVGAWPEQATSRAAALATFRGLSHRLELIRELPRDGGSVACYNDSKATTPESTMIALSSFGPGRVVLIAGGSDKGVDLLPMAQAIARTCRAAVLIGQVRDKLAGHLQEIAQSSRNAAPQVICCDTFSDAVTSAISLAHAGDAVLLSPGCASYGMFAHYEDRGNQFRRIVNGL